MKFNLSTAKIFSTFIIIIATSCRQEYILPLEENGGKAINYSGSGYVTSFRTSGSKVIFAVDISGSGDYFIDIAYSTTDKRDATVSLYINDKKVGGQLVLPETSNESEWALLKQKIILNKGLNYISIQNDADDNGLFNLDYINIRK
jgi:hypothetical protein